MTQVFPKPSTYPTASFGIFTVNKWTSHPEYVQKEFLIQNSRPVPSSVMSIFPSVTSPLNLGTSLHFLPFTLTCNPSASPKNPEPGTTLHPVASCTFTFPFKLPHLQCFLIAELGSAGSPLGVPEHYCRPSLLSFLHQ